MTGLLRRFMPSISWSLWLVFFLTLTLSDWRLVLISADGDPCLHRRIGDWMIDHHAVIHTEQFSHTRFDAPLISKEWLSEILFSAIGRISGWNAIVFLAAALIATSLFLLHRQLLAEGGELLISTGLILAAALASSLHWLARPHLITHLLTILYAWQLRDYDRGKISAPRLAFILVPLLLLWANLHGAFFTGFVMIGACVIGEALGRDWAKCRALILIGVACLLVSFINPNGWNLHLQIVSFLRASKLVTYVSEFRSPNFHTGGTRGFLVELVIALVVFLTVRPKLRPVEMVLLAVWGYFALQAVRNIPIFAFILTPILAAHITAYFHQPENSERWKRFRQLSTDLTALHRSVDGRLTAALAVLVVGWITLGPPAQAQHPWLETELLTNRFPVAAVDFVRTTPNAVTNEMFNSYGWGGYLMFALPEHKVFVDGRNDFYGAPFLDEFDEADDVRPGWEAVFKKYNVGWTILAPKHPLNSLLALRPDWHVVYTDEVATVYSRR